VEIDGPAPEGDGCPIWRSSRFVSSTLPEVRDWICGGWMSALLNITTCSQDCQC